MDAGLEERFGRRVMHVVRRNDRDDFDAVIAVAFCRGHFRERP